MLKFGRLFRQLSGFRYSEYSSDSDFEEIKEVPYTVVTENIFKTDRRFLDHTQVRAHAGRGGNGCITFIRHRGTRGAFPAGGNGGDGGSVFIRASADIHSLPSYKERKASDGAPGTGKDCDGKRGKDTFIYVPAGTIVHEVSPVGQVTKRYGLDQHGDTALIAQGGTGGRGNKKHPHLKEAEKGTVGSSATLDLELKLIADVGLVGFPNAGKSSLLGSLTRACPTVASYPFTTMRPYIGMLEFIDGVRISVADMPGLIEGAHLNKGLGHEFLRHIQRTKILLYLLDVADEPLQCLYTLYQELKQYDAKLVKKPFLLVLNKTDLADPAPVQQKILDIFGLEAVAVSVLKGHNIGEIALRLRDILQSTAMLT